jgi:signal transduction histidine kinase
LHRRTGGRSWWRGLAEWRNWRLPVKVAALLVVPALAAVVLGAIQIRGNIANASRYSDIEKLVDLRTSLTPLVDDLQSERWLATEKLGTGARIDTAAFHALSAKIDRDARTVTGLGTQLDAGSAAGIRYQGLVSQLAGLSSLHQQAFNPTADAITVVSNYGTVINSVLDLAQALSTQLGDPSVTGPAIAMTDIEIAQEQVRGEEAIVAVIISRRQLQDVELTTLNAADVLLQDRIADFQVVATPAQLASYQRSSVVSAINSREAFAQTVLSNGQTLMEITGPDHNGTAIGVSAKSWTTASDAAATQLAGLTKDLAGEIRGTATDLRAGATVAAGIESAVLIAILLMATAIGVIVGRHLLRSLGILRRTALHVAERQLPDVVASLDRGNLTGLAIAPVPVHTHEELGQLARAFDAVHAQAVESAVGQATLRSNLRNIFINLSRRSQSLVERQLRLMEKLERNEEDPQQLANLFRLDHLATRMRRNNENLMVLSGDDPARRSGHPLPLADVLRAAVSEIEQYQRVVVRSTPPVDVLGYASGDLVRLIAELLDNATTFSPPNTQVRIGGQSFAGGAVRIEIRDEGIGMAEPELADANGRLTAADTDVPVSRQMGLYVIGRLARRHSIGVSLAPAPDGGLLAVVDVPAELVKPGERPAEVVINGHQNGKDVTTILPTVPGSQPEMPIVTSEPSWGTIAGMTVPEPTVSLAPSGFTWFNTKACGPRAEPPAAPAPPGQPTGFTSVGLPRRVPRSHAVPSLVPPGQRSQSKQPQRPAPDPRRNPARARGFLDDYQSGLRGRPDADGGAGEAQ